MKKKLFVGLLGLFVLFSGFSILYPLPPVAVTTYSYTFGPNSWSATYQYKDNLNVTRSYQLNAGSSASGICAVPGSVTGGIYSQGSICP